MAIVNFNDVWEMYRIKFIIDGKINWENFWALKGISFNVEKGETVGIIGENGAGKSTILKLIAGMLKPDRGEIVVSGRVSCLLELGAGFQVELTGRENVYLNASLFGLTQSQIEEKYEEIVNFANIGKFINAPVKCYSQGMFVRLAFAIAIHVNPDILLIDDTLAVGDEHFQRKCIKKIFELKEQGKTIIFVSHDMNMLSRLCKRAIFLKDGRIVKDGLIDNVIPLYTQMIGERRGIGILEKEPLNFVFNNGRLFLNWQDKLITPNSGAHTSFLISGKWYNSLQADWEVRRENENKLVATGKFYQLALSQIWRLELMDNYTIKWDIEMDLQEPVEIQEGCTNIMLTNEYTNWFTTLEKGEFPLIDYKNKNWQALLEGNTFRKCIGVKEETSDGKISSLALEQSDYVPAAYTQISNTDYLNNCRVLQYRRLGLQNYSASQANRFFYFSGKILLDIPDIDNYLTNFEDEFVLSNGKLRLTFENGQCILCYNGINLTKASHLDTALYINGRWYSSKLANWKINKEGKNKFIAKGSWSDLPLTQSWEIEITSESSFLWSINLEVYKEVEIEQQHVSFMCVEDYKYWFSEYEGEEFFSGFLEYEMDMIQKYITDGKIGINSQNNQLPAISLKFSKELNNFAKIFNSSFNYKARVLRIDKIEPDGNIRFLPGRHPCFKIEAAFDKNKDIYINKSANILQDRRLKFIFDKGRGCIFWNGTELTRKLGLYASLRSEGRWYDSSSAAIWKIEEKDKDTIMAKGKWLYLPIIQYWEIKLKEDNFIDFNINMKVEREVEIERLQTNLMLFRKYSHWFTDKEQGTFPLFKEDVSDDWDCLWSGRENARYIGVLESQTAKISLPTVILCPQMLNQECFLNIINSDIYHQGRVLQYLNPERKILLPNYYPYFSSRIFIGSIPTI